MKPIALVGLMLCSYMTYGQFSKGDKYIDGSFSFSNSNSSNNGLQSNSRSFWVTPSFGYFIKENFALGMLAGYSNHYSKSGTLNILETQYNSISAGLFGQRFFGITDKFVFSIKGSIYYAQGNNKNTQTIMNTVISSTTKEVHVSVGFSPHFTFFPTPKWGFGASFGNLGYSYYKNATSKYTSNSFNLNYSGAISLGISYYFRKAE